MDNWTSIQVEHVDYNRRLISLDRQHEERRRTYRRRRNGNEASSVCGKPPDRTGCSDAGLHLSEILQCDGEEQFEVDAILGMV